MRTLLFLFFVSFQLSAQRILPQKWFTENNFSDVEISEGGQNKLYGLNEMKSNVKGDYFWEEAFQKGNVYFYPQKLSTPSGKTYDLDSLIGVELRVDLWNNNVEFKYGDEIKVIEAAKVSNILSLNEDNVVIQYISPKEFKSEKVKGFFELLATEKGIAFLQSKEISIQKGDYNAALDVGSKEPIVNKSDHFYFWNGEELTLLDSKKEVIGMLNSLSLDGKDYVKRSKNKLKQVEDYKELAHFVFQNLP